MKMEYFHSLQTRLGTDISLSVKKEEFPSQNWLLTLVNNQIRKKELRVG